MRIHVLSDLHLEFEPFEFQSTDADVVVLAGDIGIGRQGLAWIKEQLSDTPVVYVLGNHEYYGRVIPNLTSKLRDEAALQGVHLLDKEAAWIQGVQFLGCTLWTDFRLLDDPVSAKHVAASLITDYARVRVSPGYRRLRPSDTEGLHAGSVRFLERSISMTHDSMVIVTHHAPSAKSIVGGFSRDTLSAAFASNLDSFVESCGARLWIHGHIHQVADYSIGSTRIICNPRGYPDEPVPGFDPFLVVEV